MPVVRIPATRPAAVDIDELRRRRARLVALCEPYPETVVANPYENENRTLEVAGKRFGYLLHEHHGDDGRSGAVLKAGSGVLETLIESDPDRFWVPAFFGRHGWIGIRLDLEEPDWDEVARFVDDAWMLTAPKPLREQRER